MILFVGQSKRKKQPGAPGCFWQGLAVLCQAHCDGFVASSHDATAGLAQNVLGHCHAVAGRALVGVHSKAVLANASHFSGQIAHAHFLSPTLGQSLTGLQSGKHFERLGFRIDQFHS